jgi:hypothetical protein
MVQYFFFIYPPGWGPRQAATFEFWKERVVSASNSEDPPVPDPKKFIPKYNLPPVADYRANAKRDFWNAFPVNHSLTGTSPVSATRLKSWANAVGCADRDRLNSVCKNLENGADIGCKGEARNPTICGNASSAYDCGAQVTDAVADWIHQGIAAGPFDPKDRPIDAKVSGVMCRMKPNGTARIIQNLSAPKGNSVNDGINADDFPTTMSSTAKWLEVLDRAGRHATMTKIDWASAYKHIAVRPEDTKLQYFNWLGMDFVELMLIFGAASSAGLYDKLAKTVLDIVVRHSKFPPEMVIQYLDDACAAAPQGCDSLHKFEQAFREVAADIGVKLAPTTDPDKAFCNATAGVILGVHYDTVTWTWSIPPEKLARVLDQLRAGLSKHHLPQHEVWSLVGRILHYAPLVPCGRFNIGELIIANSYSKYRNDLVEMTSDIRRQLYFWWLMLKTTSGLASIPAPANKFPAWTLEFFTDASGGSLTTAGHGAGGIRDNFWFMTPWGQKINSGAKHTDGRRFSRKLSALELVGPLICIAADFDTCRGRPARIWVDNAGSVAIWRKGYSTRCQLCTTLVKAINRVATAAGCQLTIQKITRCSNTASELADELSKGRFAAFKRKLPADWTITLEPARIPVSILAWIALPKMDTELGDKILRDIHKN